jgi:hypothetical protein
VTCQRWRRCSLQLSIRKGAVRCDARTSNRGITLRVHAGLRMAGINYLTKDNPCALALALAGCAKGVAENTIPAPLEKKENGDRGSRSISSIFKGPAPLAGVAEHRFPPFVKATSQSCVARGFSLMYYLLVKSKQPTTRTLGWSHCGKEFPPTSQSSFAGPFQTYCHVPRYLSGFRAEGVDRVDRPEARA